MWKCIVFTFSFFFSLFQTAFFMTMLQKLNMDSDFSSFTSIFSNFFFQLFLNSLLFFPLNKMLSSVLIPFIKKHLMLWTYYMKQLWMFLISFCSITFSFLCVINHFSRSSSLQPHGLQPSRLLSPGKNTGVGFHDLLQGRFPTQGSNPHL